MILGIIKTPFKNNLFINNRFLNYRSRAIHGANLNKKIAGFKVVEVIVKGYYNRIYGPKL